jgi:hypothetical protein
MSPGSWLEELEARLNQQLESFLRTNPQQEALLAEQAQRDRQQRLLHERLKLRQEAELQRQGRDPPVAGAQRTSPRRRR